MLLTTAVTVESGQWPVRSWIVTEYVPAGRLFVVTEFVSPVGNQLYENIVPPKTLTEAEPFAPPLQLGVLDVLAEIFEFVTANVSLVVHPCNVTQSTV